MPDSVEFDCADTKIDIILHESNRVGKVDWFNACIVSGYYRIASLMLINGFDINCKDKQGKSALHVTAERDNLMNSLKFLVANHSDINQSSDEGLRAIDYAIIAGNNSAVKLLLDLGCDLNLANDQGRTLLHRAVLSANLYSREFTMAILEHER